MPVYIDAEDLTDFRQFYAAFPERAAEALSLAINDTMSRKLLPAAKAEIYSQINMPKGYLDDTGRLDVTQFATPTQLVGIVRGRDRPTSLARFATADQSVPPTKKGWQKVLSVQVKNQGSPRLFRNAFLIPLRAGDVMGGNVGLAIRLRKGETLASVHSFDPVEIYPDVYILYGPSVDQLFDSVADDITPAVMDYLDDQFDRQFQRLGY